MTQSRFRQTTARSADGTPLAMTITGDGPLLVLVEPAGHHRGFSAYDGLVAHLHPRFTVVTYDRRGRGDSGDTPPYTVEREVEDLAAVIEATAGDGSADVHGASSGALLSIQAAVHGVPIRRLSLFEPPLPADPQVPEVVDQVPDRGYVASTWQPDLRGTSHPAGRAAA